MRLIHGAASHVGLVRRQNEDSYVVGGGIYAVCDGMGGARAGEVASELACAALVELSPWRSGPEDLEEAVQKANTTVWRRGHEDPSLMGMGTTITAALGVGDALVVAHVGDSRAYRWRGGVLDQLTDDHSLVGEMVRQGQLTPEQAESHPHRSIITKALGTERDVQPDTFLVSLQPGDRVLLCTDGLSGMVPAAEVAALLGADADPQSIAESLVAAALGHGGEDNVTVVVVVAHEDHTGSDLADTAVVEPEDAFADRPFVGPIDRCAEDRRDSVASRGLERLRSIGSGRSRSEGRAPAAGCAAPAAVTGRSALVRRRRLLVWVGAVVIVALLVVAVGALVNSTVYFVGMSGDGRVALFKGMPWAPLGVALYSAVEVSAIRVADLQPYLQERVHSEDLVSKEEGLLFVRGLEDTGAPGGTAPAAPPSGSAESSSTAPSTPSTSPPSG